MESLKVDKAIILLDILIFLKMNVNKIKNKRIKIIIIISSRI